jgi:nitrate reductase gamma subunit
MRILGFIFTAVVMLTTIVERTDQWANRFRKYIINPGKKSICGGATWEKPSTIVLSKAMVVFFGLMFLIGVYVAIFS